MKNFIFLFFALLIASTFYSSCKKEKSLELIIDSAGIDSTGLPIDSTIDTTGNGNDTLVTVNDSLDYQPTSAGSFWKLEDTTSNIIENMTATPNDTTINNKLYYIFNTSMQNENLYAYIHKENGSYYMWGGIFDISGSLNDFEAIDPGIAPQLNNLEILYLKDNVEVGTSWIGADVNVNFNDSGFPSSFEDKYTFTVAEKGVTKTVDNRTFQNVIHEKLRIDFNMESSGISLMAYTINGDYYFAKGVGMIACSANQDSIGFKEDYILTDYSIK